MDLLLPFILASAAFSQGPAWAAPAHWNVVSGGLGSAMALAYDPGGSGRVYAAAATGFVFRSDDRGASWALGSLIPGFGDRVNALAVSPSSADVVCAGAPGGLFCSTDAGASWAALPGAGLFVSSVAIAPSTPSTIYAANSPPDFPPKPVLRRSNDGGVTWSTITPAGLQGATPFALAIPPTGAETLYAGGDGGLFVTHDGGGTWTPLGSFVTVDQILIDPARPRLLFVRTSFSLFRSADGGRTWAEDDPSFGPAIASLAASGSGFLYALGLLGEVDSSLHGRRPWREVARVDAVIDPGLAADFGGVLSMAADPGSAAVEIGLEEIGLLHSDDGINFRPANVGFNAVRVDQLVPAAGVAGGATLIALTEARPSSGLGFQPGRRAFGTTGPASGAWSAVSLAFPERLPRVAVGAEGVLYETDGIIDVWKSEDGGRNWLATKCPGPPVDIAASPGQPDRIVGVATGPGGPLLHPLQTLGVGSSQDGGKTWAVGAVQAEPLASWPDPFSLTARIALDPSDPSKLYVWASRLYRSGDAGASLEPVPLPNSVSAFALDPAAPNTLYVAVRPGHGPILLKSFDAGTSWHRAARGIPAGATASALAVDPSAPANVYCATDQGVFASRDGGAHWQSLNRGLEGLEVLTLAITPGSPSIVYAGTDGAGTFALAH